MYPTLIDIPSGDGSVGMHTYGLFIVLAFSAAFSLVHSRAARVGINPDRMILLYMAAAVGGLLGARILYTASVVFGTGSTFMLGAAFLALWGGLAVVWARRQVEGGSTWQPVVAGATVTAVLGMAALVMRGETAVVIEFAVAVVSLGQGGFAIYGGVLGGAAAVFAVSQFIGLSGWKVADLAGPAVLLGMGVGRIGCFFAGCCHGAIAPIGADPMPVLPEGLLQGQIWLSELFPFVTLEFHGGVGRILHEPLFPSQPVDMALLFVLSGALAWLWKHRTFDGQIAALALIVQPPIRILNESFRADERGYAFKFPVSDEVAGWFPGLTQAGDAMGTEMGVTTSQAFGLGMMVLGFVLLAVRRNAGREPDVELGHGENAFLDELLVE